MGRAIGPPRRSSPVARYAAVALLAAVCGGCASEKPTANRGAPLGPDDGLPPGPIATPAGTTTTFHVRTEVGPLGSVAYDGQVLPLVSPDGRFLAVEDGEAPPWPAMLAEPGADLPASTRISVYDLGTVPLRRVEYPDPPPMGLLLGRAANESGFLVEWPRQDGARWIGLVSWASGSIRWLVQGDALNAHGVFTRTGELVHTRIETEGPASLVLRRPDGTESVLTDAASFAFPLVGGDPGLIYAILRTERSTDLAAIRVVEDPPGSGTRRLGSIVSRRSLASSGDPALAYQVTAPVQLPPPAAAGAFWAPEAPLAVYHPRFARMAAFDPADGSFIGLAPKSIAAVFWPRAGREGYFCTTPTGLVFTPLPTPEEIDSTRPRPPDARVLASPYVPRLTGHPERPLILMGPSSQDPRRLQIFGMRLDSESVPGR